MGNFIGIINTYNICISELNYKNTFKFLKIKIIKYQNNNLFQYSAFKQAFVKHNTATPSSVIPPSSTYLVQSAFTKT